MLIFFYYYYSIVRMLTHRGYLSSGGILLGSPLWRSFSTTIINRHPRIHRTTTTVWCPFGVRRNNKKTDPWLCRDFGYKSDSRGLFNHQSNIRLEVQTNSNKLQNVPFGEFVPPGYISFPPRPEVQLFGSLLIPPLDYQETQNQCWTRYGLFPVS